MKIFYVADVLVPSRAAASVHIMKMCAAFATYGHDVTLILPDYKNTETADNIFTFYNVAENFKIKKFSVKQYTGGKYIYSFLLARFLKKQSPGLIYCRDVYSASVFSFLNMPVSIEYHREPRFSKGLWKVLLKKLYKSANLIKVIVISEALRKIFLQSGFSDNKLIVAHDGADIPATVPPVALDAGKFHAGYVGHLYEGKGMEIIAATAPLVNDIEFHVVGGTEADIARWKSKVTAANITFHGFVPQSKVSGFINAFNVCLLPNQRVIHIWGSNEVNISDITSPLKMFEYMAHRKAIIASDLPVLREVLNEDNSLLCDPDRPEDWASALKKVKGDKQLINRIADNAYNDLVEHYTWEKRAGEIVNKIISI
jgi:glycosyltransferase involved in cell wall biosynthesis